MSITAIIILDTSLSCVHMKHLLIETEDDKQENSGGPNGGGQHLDANYTIHNYDKTISQMTAPMVRIFMVLNLNLHMVVMVLSLNLNLHMVYYLNYLNLKLKVPLKLYCPQSFSGEGLYSK